MGARGELAAPADADSPVAALAVQTAAFADAFARWAGRKAVEAGASVPRLRLLYAVHCHGPQKMADLAEELTVTPRNVTALVDGLEAEGLVRRVPHSTDRRVTLVELTCNSERVAAQFGAYQASIAGLFAGLGAEDQRTLLRLLTTLHDRMHAEAGCSTARVEADDA
ncbi:MAG: MarR family transcriptional regulator [Candidatus Limnocylindrales bacterium]|jgi:DNA-binding MarR family transcriptional regulator